MARPFFFPVVMHSRIRGCSNLELGDLGTRSGSPTLTAHRSVQSSPVGDGVLFHEGKERMLSRWTRRGSASTNIMTGRMLRFEDSLSAPTGHWTEFGWCTDLSLNTSNLLMCTSPHLQCVCREVFRGKKNADIHNISSFFWLYLVNFFIQIGWTLKPWLKYVRCRSHDITCA